MSFTSVSWQATPPLRSMSGLTASWHVRCTKGFPQEGRTMKHNLLSRTLHPVLILGLLPLVGGCTLHARARFAVPTATVVATVPAPPRIDVVIPAPPRVVVTPPAPPRVEVTTPAPLPEPEPIVVSTPAPVYEVVNYGIAEVRPIAVAVAPPAPPANAIHTAPAPRPGYFWVEGYYRWVNHTWVWRSGHWTPMRHGYTWVAPQYDASRRLWVRAHWESLRSEVRTVRPTPPPRRPSIQVNIPTPPPPPRPPRVTINFGG